MYREPMDSYPDRYVVLRSGGLGDFVLALPLVQALAARASVTLVTRRSYWELIGNSGLANDWVDIDSVAVATLFTARPAPEVRTRLRGAVVCSFLPDPHGQLRDAVTDCGAAGYHLLESRPAAPPHVTARMFESLKLPLPAEFPRLSVLQRQGQRGRRLWVHPGSGSPAKNAPLERFADIARRWVRQTGGEITVSIGEADLSLLEQARPVFLPETVFRVCPSLSQLRDGLAGDAAEYVGNDSGVSHLAAALGIPVTAIFRTTDPRIWRPIGTRVTVCR